MDDLPYKIRKDIIIYSLPLFLINLSRSEFNNKFYFLTIPGSILGMIPITSKSKLIVSSFLYLAHIFIPSLYFLILGFILQQSYNSNILVSKSGLVSNFIAKIEIVAFLCSDLVQIPIFLKIIFSCLILYISITSKNVSIESRDPFESMKNKIESANMLNLEYRTYLNNKIGVEYNNPIFYTEIFYMISNYKTLVLFCSFFSIKRSELILLFIGILYIFRYRWEYLCLILKVETTRNVLLRVICSYFIYLVYLLIEPILIEQ